MRSDTDATRRSAAPALLLRPRPEDRALLSKANGLFRGYHLAANQSASLTDVVRGYGKPFLVDPQTYIFSVPPSRHFDTEKNTLRRTSATLSSAYGEPFGSIVGVRRIMPDDLADSELLADAVSRVLGYQRDKALGQMGLPLDPYYDKYRLWDDEPGAAGLIPQVLIPPYFYFKSPTDPWLGVNLCAARKALELRRGQERVYPVLLFSEKLLDDEAAVDATVAAFLSEPFDGYLLWPNRFDEVRQSAERLRALARLVSSLAASGRRVSKLYGGYWSVLMGPRGLGGVSCGLGYSSSRNAFAYGGRNGKTVKNYYIPQLHLSVPLEEAFRMVEAEPRLRCACQVCSETYGRRTERFVAMRERSKCEAHFLNARREEMNLVAESGTLGAIRDLKETCKRLKSSAVATDFLDVWMRALAS
jgi:hypothetical protein